MNGGEKSLREGEQRNDEVEFWSWLWLESSCGCGVGTGEGENSQYQEVKESEVPVASSTKLSSPSSASPLKLNAAWLTNLEIVGSWTLMSSKRLSRSGWSGSSCNAF